MDWEDCVVDVHSVKLPKTVLETMFKKCGPVCGNLDFSTDRHLDRIY
jgi:hypothetical protein